MKQRYFRMYPDRVRKLDNWLGPDLAMAYVRVLCHYVEQAGDIRDDDALLAKLAEIPLKRWQVLRTKLLDMGIARVEAGRWIDEDQDESIQHQIKYSAGQARKALIKAEKERAEKAARGNGANHAAH